jgi:hypothetical protein
MNLLVPFDEKRARKVTVGRKAGAKKYNDDILLNIIEGIRPISAKDWERIASAYKDSTNESVLREYAVVKRYFIEKLCNNNKKPTGEAAPPVKVARAQRIYHAILAKSGCGNYGASSDDDDDEEDELLVEDDDHDDEGQTYEDVNHDAVAQTQTVNDVVPLGRDYDSQINAFPYCAYAT